MIRASLRAFVLVTAVLTLVAGMTACGGNTSDLKQLLAEKKKRPGSHIAPLPQMAPYESFTYDPTGLRSPFAPSVVVANGTGGIRPDAHRNREFLESSSLDTLRMVGTLRVKERVYGLIQSKDGLIHRVAVGNYVGQNDGKILSITESKITVVEIVPDGMGAYVERPALIPLATH
jgi:type IV pilus assembly protein PilP